MRMSLKVYYDVMSQPARAVLLFLKTNNIPYTDCSVALRKGENLTATYTDINPFKKVPCIDDGGFRLSESVAILKYLSDKHGTFNWYPRDLCTRARVDEYLAWQHMNTRASAAMYFRTLAIDPVVTGKPIDYALAEKYRRALNATLDSIENIFLRRGLFLCGNTITIADLLGVCELEQPMAVGFDVKTGRPILRAWMERVENRLEPHYSDVHKIIKSFGQRFKEKQKAKL